MNQSLFVKVANRIPFTQKTAFRNSLIYAIIIFICRIRTFIKI